MSLIVSICRRQNAVARTEQALRYCSSKASLVRTVSEQLQSYLQGLGNEKEPVVRLKSPEQLQSIFSAKGVGFGLENQGALEDFDVAEAVNLVLRYSVRTGHPLFLNQLYSQADEVSILGDWISATTNTNAHTFEVAPVYAMIEEALIRKIASLVGGRYKDEADGLFVPGGSLSNLYGMHLAHNRACPDFGRKGADGKTFVAFTSDQSHYSYLKSARLTGLGSDNLISIQTDTNGRMIPDKLEQAIVCAKNEGKTPFFVGSTAGTTVIGAFDPFEEINAICRNYGGLWHHIDGCWGGSSLLSDKTRHLMRGVDGADSFAWNPHKMIGSTLQTSFFMVPSSSILKKCNATNASYLFQPDKLHTQLDAGDKTIQCGRKTDMLKLWLQWKSRGDKGLAKMVEHSFQLARHTVEQMREDADSWVIVYPPSCTNVCFWYVPKSLRPFNPETATREQVQAMHKVAPRIKKTMQECGDAMIGFQSIDNKPNFFRLVFPSCHRTTTQHVDQMLRRMTEIGDDLCV